MTMQAGDFSVLADSYHKFRPDYSARVLDALVALAGAAPERLRIADIGAGTGIWTRMLAERGLSGFAVEPNDAMRTHGQEHTRGFDIAWRPFAAEETGLADQCVDWVTMASSFHWTRPERSLPEFARILKPFGRVTVLWNPRDIAESPFHQGIEDQIARIVPELKRVSSGSDKHSADYFKVLTSTGHFEDVLFIEAKHEIRMTPERYLGAWRSVNDVQRQAGPERFEKIMSAIAREIEGMNEIVVPYRTRSWTARRRS